MRRLFNTTNERYTEEANSLDRGLHLVMSPIMERYIAEGASIRDVGLVASLVVTDITLDGILNLPR